MTGIDPPTLQRRRKTACRTVASLTRQQTDACLLLVAPLQMLFWKKLQAGFSPNATDEPQQQEEPEHWSQAGQTSKHPVDCQRHNQYVAAPSPVS